MLFTLSLRVFLESNYTQLMKVLVGLSSGRSTQLQCPDSHNVWQLLLLSTSSNCGQTVIQIGAQTFLVSITK